MSLPALRYLLIAAVCSASVMSLGAAEPPRLAHYRFDGKVIDLSKGKASLELKNEEFKEQALYLNGVYELNGKNDGYRAICNTPALNYDEFTIAIRLKPQASGGNLFTGGKDHRWFGMRKSSSDNLIIMLNNAEFSHEIKDAELPQGAWAEVACAFSLKRRKVLVFVNGKKAEELELPKDFALKVITLDPLGNDKLWSFSDYGWGFAFHGFVSEFVIFPKALAEEDLGKVRFKKSLHETVAEPSAADEGVELLAQGPVHEAFAHPVETRPQPRPRIAEAPPVELEETPPSEKPQGENVEWIPGYWSWDEDRAGYIWVSGVWRKAPPGRQWLPGHWTQKGKVWQRAAGLWAAAGQTELQFLPAPPRPLDVSPPTSPGDNSVFVPGIWAYRADRYHWRPGFWLAHRPNWVWIPAHYVWSPAGYLFSEGYWDYPLAERGLLFAPLIWNKAANPSAGTSFAPRYVLNPEYLLSALFARRGMGAYFFGDYFGARYEKAGFVTWMDNPPAKYSYDPLFAYYRAMHFDDRNWDRDLRAMYQSRMNTASRPAVKWIDRTGALIDPKLKESAQSAITQLDKIDRALNNLEIAPAERMEALRDAVKQSQGLGVRRQELEANLLDKKSNQTDLKDKARTVTFDLSRGMSPKGADVAKTPSLPTLPKHEDRPYTVRDDIKPVDLLPPLAKKEASTVAAKTGTRSKGWEVKGPVITKTTETTPSGKPKPSSKPVKP